MKSLIHITSDMAKGWADLSEAWNTMQVGKDADGFMTVSFDRMPLHMRSQTAAPAVLAAPRSTPTSRRTTPKPYVQIQIGYMDDDYDPLFAGMTEAEFFGDVGDKG